MTSKTVKGVLNTTSELPKAKFNIDDGVSKKLVLASFLFSFIVSREFSDSLNTYDLIGLHGALFIFISGTIAFMIANSKASDRLTEELESKPLIFLLEYLASDRTNVDQKFLARLAINQNSCIYLNENFYIQSDFVDRIHSGKMTVKEALNLSGYNYHTA